MFNHNVYNVVGDLDFWWNSAGGTTVKPETESKIRDSDHTGSEITLDLRQ